MEKERVIFLDYLRVIACFMVIVVHNVEPFYLGHGGTYIESWEDGFWCTVIDSAFRAAVPLFLLASSYLQFPVKYDTATFFKKRLVRVGIPFAVFSILYAIIPLYGTKDIDIATNLKNVCFNFVGVAGHLWFIYMLLGIYILMPMLSPWIEKISKKEEQIFLGVWAFTTLFPFLRPVAESIFGLPELWGEANWNEFGTFYYISGFIGYLVMGHYFRKYVGELSWTKTLLYAIPLWLIGYAIVAGGFWMGMPKVFPVSESIDLVVKMETTWRFCSFGVMLTSVAYFLIFRKFTLGGKFYEKIILPISNKSYGMYLMHIFILVPTFEFVSNLGIYTPCVIILSAILTYLICVIITKVLSYIPYHKYIIG